MKKIFLALLFTTGLAQAQINMIADSAFTVKVCNDFIYDSGGPDGYFDSQKLSSITLQPKEKGKILHLEIQNLLISNGQTLAIYNGKAMDDKKLIAEFSRVWGKASVYGEELTVVFNTNGNENTDHGFNAEVKCIETYPVLDYSIKMFDPKPYINGTNRLFFHVDHVLRDQFIPSTVPVKLFVSKKDKVDKDSQLIYNESVYLQYNTGLSVNRDFDHFTNLPKGKYFFIFQVDPNNTVKESNENNNTFIFPIEIQ